MTPLQKSAWGACELAVSSLKCKRKSRKDEC